MAYRNVIEAAHEGCYLLIPPPIGGCEGWGESRCPVWCLSHGDIIDGEDFDYGEEDEDQRPPDLVIDPDDGTLAVVNLSRLVPRTYFVTVENCSHVVSADGVDLLGDAVLGNRRLYVTFVVLLFPRSFAELATLVPKASANKKVTKKSRSKKGKRTGGGQASGGSFSSIKVSSDIQDFVPSSASASDLEPFLMDIFPLFDSSGSKPFLCTQSSGGALTHFAHPSTFHAVDFKCDIGTPIVAVVTGEVLEVKKESTVCGPHVSNLFSWNSILIKKDGEELYIEYVHIHADGVLVSVGQHVEAGQPLCLSGASGFCPEPHLHLQAQRGRSVGSPSVPIFFRGMAVEAGRCYSPS